MAQAQKEGGKAKTKSTGLRLVLRVAHLIRWAGVDNPHQFAIKSGVSAPSIANWNNDPAGLQIIYLRTFLRVLMDGLGLNKNEILNLRIRDLFEIVEEDDVTDTDNANGNGHHKAAKAAN